MPAPAPKPTPIKGSGKKATPPEGPTKIPEKKTKPTSTPPFHGVVKKPAPAPMKTPSHVPDKSPKSGATPKTYSKSHGNLKDAAGSLVPVTPKPTDNPKTYSKSHTNLKDAAGSLVPVTPKPTDNPKTYSKSHTNLKDAAGNLIPVTPTPTVKGKKLIPPDFQIGDQVDAHQIDPGGKKHKLSDTQTPGDKVAPPSLKEGDKGKNDFHFWINTNVMPPPPSALGPPLVIPKAPPPQAVPKSKVNVVPGGAAPIPKNYTPPAADAPVEVSPTALRAWNGQEVEGQRAFDQTQVQVAATAEGTMPWQFYWKTTGPQAKAARWEVAAVPFVEGSTDFPPPGLVGYGDASENVEGPLTENFFAVDFHTFAQNFAEGEIPKIYYMRVVAVDQEGNPIGKPSNFVRVDLP
jgi:hypothetical protein